MAGVSTKEIKTRIRSMESTKQITKAMEMVASSKLRRAQAQVSASRPYFKLLHKTISDIVSAERECESAYLKEQTAGKPAYIVIAGDRGLAGGYNNNVFKLVMERISGSDAQVLPIGRKAADFFHSHHVAVISDAYRNAESMSVGDCFSAAKALCKGFLAGQFSQVNVVYTDFVSVLSQTPVVMPLLPLLGVGQTQPSQILYEPSASEVLEAIVPEYLGGVLYGALCESRASEQAARRNAMDAASQNADEMIADLSLQFNRARQAAITQEITEIVAGS